METLTWQEVLNTLQNLTSEQLTQPVTVRDADGDTQHLSNLCFIDEFWSVENDEFVSFPVLVL